MFCGINHDGFAKRPMSALRFVEDRCYRYVLAVVEDKNKGCFGTSEHLFEITAWKTGIPSRYSGVRRGRGFSNLGDTFFKGSAQLMKMLILR